MTTDLQTELEVLKTNLASGMCVEKRASKKQQALRKRRIAEIEELLRPGAEL